MLVEAGEAPGLGGLVPAVLLREQGDDLILHPGLVVLDLDLVIHAYPPSHRDGAAVIRSTLQGPKASPDSNPREIRRAIVQARDIAALRRAPGPECPDDEEAMKGHMAVRSG